MDIDALKWYSKDPAFPYGDDPEGDDTEGLTRHEYIAAMLLQGMLANPTLSHFGNTIDDDEEADRDLRVSPELVEHSVELALILVDRVSEHHFREAADVGDDDLMEDFETI